MTAWDAFDAYLFDIDGTLLTCRDAVHYFAFCNALTQVAEHPLNLDGVATQGNTDVGILRDAFALAQVPEHTWRPRLAEIQAGMGDFVEAHTQEFEIETMPLIARTLDHLKGRGAVLGVATGNLKRIGEAKLTHAGLLERFDFGGYSDAFESRRDVFAAALLKANTRLQQGPAVCVVGDTPADVQAAKACGLPVIAVATGVFSHETLAAEKPNWCLHSFADVLKAK